jgi:NAD(P)H-dependent FMN reductase
VNVDAQTDDFRPGHQPPPAVRIAVIVGSTRPNRKGEAVSHWVLGEARKRQDAEFELVDLVAHHLPEIDEQWPPAAGKYQLEHTTAWADTVARYDGYVVVTPEYNHAMPGALKNALDRVYAEWSNKAAGFVSYGFHGGVRAAEQLRTVMSALNVATVGPQVALNLMTDFAGPGELAPSAHQHDALANTLNTVVAWSAALAPLRRATPA